MEKIKCKECGKSLSAKAEICPNCGCRVGQNGFIGFLKKVYRFLSCLVVIGVASVAVYYSYHFVKDFINDYKTKAYLGTWELQTSEQVITYTNYHKTEYLMKHPSETLTKEILEQNKTEDTLIIDKKINITKSTFEKISIKNIENLKKNSSKKAFALLNHEDDTVKVTFNKDDGSIAFICFEKKKNKLVQTSCELNSDDTKYDVDTNLKITYKKVS